MKGVQGRQGFSKDCYCVIAVVRSIRKRGVQSCRMAIKKCHKSAKLHLAPPQSGRRGEREQTQKTRVRGRVRQLPGKVPARQTLPPQTGDTTPEP